MVGSSPFTNVFLQNLKALVLWREKLRDHKPHPHPLPVLPQQKMRTSYNLFAEEVPQNHSQELNQLKQFIRETYGIYLSRAYNVSGLESARVNARCFGNVQRRGQRTYPHYHHTCDHVFVLYLDCGYNRGEAASVVNRSGDGELLLQDPRHFSSFPFWEKIRQVNTYPGLMLLHPAFLWHETNTMFADGERVVLIVTLKMMSHNYSEIYTSL